MTIPPPAPAPPSRERIYRHNFAWLLADNVLWNLAAGIIGPTTVVPDFVRRLTDSEILIGFLGNLPVVGNALPQLLVARLIVRHERKQWWFVGPNIPARFMALIFAGILLWVGASRPDLVLFAFCVCYGIALFGNGLASVPWAELAGTSLDNRWRARVLGITSAAVGLLMLGIAPLIGAVLGDAGPGYPNNYVLLFGAAGLLFALSILPGIFVHELPGGKTVPRLPALGEFVPDLARTLRSDLPFRGYVVARMLVGLSLTAAPFYVGYATVRLRLSSEVAVPVLLVLQTIGNLAGAVAYTWLGVRSNLLAMRLSLGCLILLPMGALLAGSLGPPALYFGFFASGLAISMWNAGYLNWIVGYARPEQRPMYVGLSNTLAAVLTLISPLIAGLIVERSGFELLFAAALAMALGALFVALRYLRDARGGVTESQRRETAA